jgi:HrpA-like RNA helicase
MFHSLEAEAVPDIRLVSLVGVELLLMTAGVADQSSYENLDRPSKDALRRAIYDLCMLHELEVDSSLTPHGHTMAALLLPPVLAGAIIAASTLGVLEPVATIAAMLFVEHVFWFGAHAAVESAAVLGCFADTASNYESNGRSAPWARENCVQQIVLAQAAQVRQQLLDNVQSLHGLEPANPAPMTWAIDSNAATRRVIMQALLHGFVQNVAWQQGDDNSNHLILGNDKSGVGTNKLHIHPSPSLFAKRLEIVFFHEVVAMSRLYMRHVTRIDNVLLQEALGNMASASLPTQH